MADLPTQLGTATYSPYDYDNYLQIQNLQDLYQRYAELAANSGGNYVALPSGSPSAPRNDPQLDEVVVTGERPSLSDRQFPVVVSPFETHDMNDQELADYYGGGDAGYETMWAERHPNEDLPEQEINPPDESFVPPIGLLYPGVGTLSTLVTAVLGGIGALFLPQPMGPRDLDEAPVLPPKPPRTPLPKFDEPTPPNWEDFLHDYDFYNGPYLYPLPGDPRFTEIGDPLPRRLAPEPNNPGLPFVDPFLPDFPEPDFFPRTAPGPSPSRPTPFPFGDPTPFIFADPFRNPFDQPYFWPNPDPTATPRDNPVPRIDAPPKVDLPPKIADPYTPPDIYTPPPIGDPIKDFFPDVPYAPPDVFFDPYTIPSPGPQGQPKPDQAGCDCTKVKDKKPKKKKSKSREICYEGHYIEHARGLTKVRGKQIPCDTKAARKPRTRTPSLPDLARDVFQLPGV